MLFSYTFLVLMDIYRNPRSGKREENREVDFIEEKYMERAIELAKQGIGAVNPNPLVGAVIVKKGNILAEGYHRRYGELHAERDAFSQLTESAKGAELYVTLEPCCHYGKQPPCTQAIIEHGIKKVYVGSQDPNELVAGKGIRLLKNAGIEVETGILKEACDELNTVFFHYITKKTPYVVMKYAMSLDGKTAAYTGKSRWISGEESRRYVHELRNALTGIMVGIKTVLQDDPMLNCRIEGGRNPVRIICDSGLNLPLDSKIVQTAKEIRTIVLTVTPPSEKWKRLEERQVEILLTKEADGRVDLNDAMRLLGEQQIDGILLEGGGTLNEAALRAGIVNRVVVFLAPMLLGGNAGYSPVSGQGVESPKEAWRSKPVKMTKLGEDFVFVYDIL